MVAVVVVMGGVELRTGMFLSFPPVPATVHSVLPQSSAYSRQHEAHHIPLTIHQHGGLHPVVPSATYRPDYIELFTKHSATVSS